jgi:hypothetical protein
MCGIVLYVKNMELKGDYLLLACRYLIVAVLHPPCYAVFPLVVKLKMFLLSRLFPHSYHFLR